MIRNTMKKFCQFLSILVLVFPALASGDCIEGDCKNGFGIYIFPEGGEYAGQFSEGKFAGTGKHVFADGNRYEGMFEDGTVHGTGTLTYADGSIYSGEFNRGTISGKGSMVFTNNSKYEGEFADGLFQGRGIYTFGDESRYEGEFKKGLEFREGDHYSKGTITYFDKSQEIGEWKNGEFIVLQKIKAPPQKRTKDSEGEDAFFGDEENADSTQKGFWGTQQDVFISDEVFSPEPPLETGQEDIFSGDDLAAEQEQQDIFSEDDLAEETESVSPAACCLFPPEVPA
jgi:hypothetical protein